MRISGFGLQQKIATVLVGLALPIGASAASTQPGPSSTPATIGLSENSISGDGSPATSANGPSAVIFPDSPGALQQQPANSPSPQPGNAGDQPNQTPAQAAGQPPAQPPVGTAAAPVSKPEGVPGSTPAGAAIAPAKQKRVRTFAIRTALVVAAVVAVGVVVGLSEASSSRPN